MTRQLLRDLDPDLLAGVVRALEGHRKLPEIERARHRYRFPAERDIAINPVVRSHQQLSHHGARSSARDDVKDGGIIGVGAQHVTYRRRCLDDRYQSRPGPTKVSERRRRDALPVIVARGGGRHSRADTPEALRRPQQRATPVCRSESLLEECSRYLSLCIEAPMARHIFQPKHFEAHPKATRGEVILESYELGALVGATDRDLPT